MGTGKAGLLGSAFHLRIHAYFIFITRLCIQVINFKYLTITPR